MAPRSWLGFFAVCGAVVLAVVGAAAVVAASASVAAVNYEFNPSSVTVSVGDTVVWTMSGDGHTVRSGTVGSDNVGHPSDGPLDSGFKGPGESYSFTFAQAGTYRYFCEIHPEQMTGTITVVTAPPGTSAPVPIASASSGAAVTPPASGGTPSAAITPAGTPIGSGNGQSTASDSTPLLVGGIAVAIALVGITLALARRNR